MSNNHLPTVIRFVDSVTLEKFKQQARQIKRELNISHTDALEKVALLANFPNWHHVVEAHKLVAPSEKAWTEGVVLAFDQKDLSEVDFDPSMAFERDPMLELICRKSLAEAVELDVDSEEMDEFGYVRLRTSHTPTSLSECLALMREDFFWPAEWIRFKGEWIPQYDDVATDNEGNIVGIKFNGL